MLDKKIGLIELLLTHFLYTYEILRIVRLYGSTSVDQWVLTCIWDNKQLGDPEGKREREDERGRGIDHPAW
jgi:hypothetical protein